MNIGHDYDRDYLSPSSDCVNSEEESEYFSEKSENIDANFIDKDFLKFHLPSINNFLWNNNNSTTDGKDTTNDRETSNIPDSRFQNTRKEQLQTFLNDLSNGFSMKFAAQRLSYLRSTTRNFMNSSYLSYNTNNNTNNNTNSNDDGNNNNAPTNSLPDNGPTMENIEPSGVDLAIQPIVPPLIDEVVYPKTTKKKKRITKRKKKSAKMRRKDFNNRPAFSESDSNYYFSETDEEYMDTMRLFKNYEAYVNLDAEEYKHPDILRKRIITITKIHGLSDKHKGQLVQRLMLGRTRIINERMSEEIANMKIEENEDWDIDEADESDEEIDDIKGEEEEQDEEIKEQEEEEEEEEEEEDDDEDDDQQETKTIGKATGDKMENGKLPSVKILSVEERESFHNEDEQIYGCPHYQTSCKLQCPTCLKFYACRNCHDAQEHTHLMSRKDVHTIACMVCGNIQPPEEECIECENVFADYFCEKCKLYDNDPNKNIYHCEDCGICRLGLGLGVDYYHCHGCNACISVLLENDHKCIENRTKCNCPICGDFMFTSKKKVVVMPCGHAIHQHCYDEYVKNFYKCPICSRTIIDMAARFREIDEEIEIQPMPEPYNLWKCVIACNDCNTKSVCNYHILGLKCDICQSYNTAQVRLIKPEDNVSRNAVMSEDGIITNTEYEEDEDFTVDDYAKTLGINNNQNNNLLKTFFNDNSEHIPSDKAKLPPKKANKNQRHRRGDSVSKRTKGRTKSRSNSLMYNQQENIGATGVGYTKKFTSPVISNTFTNNIRSMINSATTSTNNYYNDFITAALESLDKKNFGEEEAFTEGDLINLNKINNLNFQDFFNGKNFKGKEKYGSSQNDNAATNNLNIHTESGMGGKAVDTIDEEDLGPADNSLPSLGYVLKKWVNSTAGISDTEDEELSDEEEDEANDEANDDNEEEEDEDDEVMYNVQALNQR
ncbi:hypothetical protein DASC09_007730 [Saccharomycopsis crataegensis]|uniref:Zf-CHY-domain-containing protein n=1 Tax=Saccharomycopsis crataegensis TaxID=43959 RepID=A0AAV5QGZ7_9ASCO|nr:hypothetical protein DASC09_007730 [Saccharomycopsis crataegensis]